MKKTGPKPTSSYHLQFPVKLMGNPGSKLFALGSNALICAFKENR